MSTDASLPRDVNTLHRELLRARQELAHTEAVLAETATTCEAQQAQLARLQEELELLKRYLFGRKSEWHVVDPRQGMLPLGDEPQEAPLPPAPEEEITYRRRQRGHGWSKLPKNLPREEVLPDGERQCSACGQAIQKIGEDRSERLHLMPARVWVSGLLRSRT